MWVRETLRKAVVLPTPPNRFAYVFYVFPSFFIFFVYLDYKLFRPGILPPSSAFTTPTTARPQSWLEPRTATTVQTIINKTRTVKRL